MSTPDLKSLPPFSNEPFTDFSSPAQHREMLDALVEVRSELGKKYDLLIGGHRRQSGKTFSSTNPARPAEVVGMHHEATVAQANEAVDAATKVFATWKHTTAAERASLLFRAAQLIRERHFTFCAWLTFEVGKNWAEADADVGECIDFLEFYAREALRLDASTTPIQFPGERNALHHVPLGVGAIIPPWNFPFAIMAGMTAAAIVCGNTVVLKPSPDAPTIAVKFVQLLEEAGMPLGVVNLLQGGPEVGQTVVEHPKVHFIAFTGSKKVGLEIHERAASTQPGQKFIKRTILEMGGKDAIIVESDADLDSAADGVVAAAFGFNGQKCSACSRAIVSDSVYDAFCELIRDRVANLSSGDPAENKAMGPVINHAAFQRVLSYIDLGKSEGRLIAGGKAIANADAGYLIEPTVFADVASRSRLAQEEIFGPVLVIIRSKDFSDALAIANDTEYGLTGAIYSTSREKLNRARDEFHVGNLYLNRKCTGAMVGAHPFGGFNMSGTDSKAGGPDYLTLFTQGKSVAEKVGVVSEHDEKEEQLMGGF